ncbi:hypothetical protein M569_11062, partial [Genlisea aurea]
SAASRGRSDSSRSRQKEKDRSVAAQTSIDAKIHGDFERSEEEFDYSSAVDASGVSFCDVVPSSAVASFLRKMQGGSLIQPFGCLIAVGNRNFDVLAYSENSPEMLELSPCSVPSMEERQEVLRFGTDVRNLFQPPDAAQLQSAAKFGDVDLLNPILVHSKASGKPFYAILHRIDAGLVIELEPVNPSDGLVTAAGSLKSYKLAAKAVSRLQSLSGGNIPLLCTALVKEIKDLTGYDRVMVYRFHEDDHGEVVAECCRPDLEPYLGLHYPATDIPQASRFLFMKNKVRMICDCSAEPVNVVHDGSLSQPLSLAGSTLRSPHGCHAQYMANMGSIASLVISITINDGGSEFRRDGDRKLWGLVVCHHTTSRFVPFPLRYACQFLIQVFAVQINKEVEMAAQLRERDILRTKTALCDMLLRNAPVGIMMQSPNVMDLVRCDGAALLYGKRCWMLGTTPTEPQIIDIVGWLQESHGGNTGLSTDSLAEAGYPGASVLGDAVCGMAAVKFRSNGFLFWFRSNAAKDIKWGGAKHDPDDDGKRMHPRSSFRVFLEVVKRRSLPWEHTEMDAIHSLQLILRGALRDEKEADESEMMASIPAVDGSIQRMEELSFVTNEMVRLIETASIPILAVDTFGAINGWNNKVAELTGLDLRKALGRNLVDLVQDDSVHRVKNTLFLASQGVEETKVEMRLKGRSEAVVVMANACCSRDVNGDIVGACFVGQDITGHRSVVESYDRLRSDYLGIIRNPCSLIPPIFVMDVNGVCVEWNDAMAKLSGVRRERAVGRMLLGEVFTVRSFGFRLRDQDTLTKLMILLNTVIAGRDAEGLLFGYFNERHEYAEAFVLASGRRDLEGRITGVLCFLHVAGPDLRQAMKVERISERVAANAHAKLAYIRREIGNPLSGIKFVQSRLKSSKNLSDEQSRLVDASGWCHDRLAQVVADADLLGTEGGGGSKAMMMRRRRGEEFDLWEALAAVRDEVAAVSAERQVRVIGDLPSPGAPTPTPIRVVGDRLRLQQALSDLLAAAVAHAPPASSGGSAVVFRLARREETMKVLRLEIRIVYRAPGIPEEAVEKLFYEGEEEENEWWGVGVGLSMCVVRELIRMMNGRVQYLREAGRVSLIVFLEFPLA